MSTLMSLVKAPYSLIVLLVVPLMVYLLMPAFQRLLRPWLRPSNQQAITDPEE